MVGVAPAETEVVALYNELLRLVGDEGDIVRVRQILWRLQALSRRYPGDFPIAVAHCRAAAMAGDRAEALAASGHAWSLRNKAGAADAPTRSLIQVIAGLGQYGRAIQAARAMLATEVEPRYAINYLVWCGLMAGDVSAIETARAAAIRFGIGAWKDDLADLQQNRYAAVAPVFADVINRHVGGRQLGFYARTAMDRDQRTWTILVFVAADRNERRVTELLIDEEFRARCEEVDREAGNWAERLCVVLVGHYPQVGPLASVA